MDSIKIEVTGNIASVVEKPAVITSGTVGLPAEFTFDSAWDGLGKTVVFKACGVKRSVVYSGKPVIVPWEVLSKPGVMLTVGVTGSSEDDAIVIPTVYANISMIKHGTTTDGDPGTDVDPTLPIWGQILADLEAIRQYVDGETTHNHSASDINSGTLDSDRLPIVPLAKGGTGATTAEEARANLDITPANIGAALEPIISTTDITAGGAAPDGRPYHVIE